MQNRIHIKTNVTRYINYLMILKSCYLLVNVTGGSIEL